MDDLGETAIHDNRLPLEHREFLGALTRDGRGYPLYDGYAAGVGAVYGARPL